jgi:hypothetical protein
MIRHIVFWKLKPDAEGMTKAENAAKIVELLNSLEGKVPGLLAIEAGVDFNHSDAAWDVALYTKFPSKEALNAYQIHPEHLKVATFIKTVVSNRCVVDYEV